MCHLNIRSLLAKDDNSNTSKFDELTSFAVANDFDIIGISETWLSEAIKNEDIVIAGFQSPIRKDRNRHGGGIAVYVSDDCPATHMPV